MVSRSPAAEYGLVVEQQVSRSLAVLYSQSRECMVLVVKLQHTIQVNRADDIGIMQNKRLVPLRIGKEIGGFLQTAASVQ